MSESVLDEQRYLQAAFAISPNDWFRPGTIETSQFSDRQIERIVASLVVQGMLDAQPQCHARLTDMGRKHATSLKRLAARDWPSFYRRRRVRIVTASVTVAVLVLLVVLRVRGLV
jgi:hypothetical protein